MILSKRRVFWFFLCLILLFVGGTVFSSAPDYEVHYYRETPFRYCAKGGNCRINYVLLVGNTGTEPQEEVAVNYHAAITDRIKRPLVARMQGVAGIDLETTRDETHLTYYIDNFKPRKYVQLEFVVEYMRHEGEPPWEKILDTVEPSRGSAHRGDPRMVRFGRFLFGILKLV